MVKNFAIARSVNVKNKFSCEELGKLVIRISKMNVLTSALWECQKNDRMVALGLWPKFTLTCSSQ